MLAQDAGYVARNQVHTRNPVWQHGRISKSSSMRGNVRPGLQQGNRIVSRDAAPLFNRQPRQHPAPQAKKKQPSLPVSRSQLDRDLDEYMQSNPHYQSHADSENFFGSAEQANPAFDDVMQQ